MGGTLSLDGLQQNLFECPFPAERDTGDEDTGAINASHKRATDSDHLRATNIEHEPEAGRSGVRERLESIDVQQLLRQGAPLTLYAQF